MCAGLDEGSEGIHEFWWDCRLLAWLVVLERTGLGQTPPQSQRLGRRSAFVSNHCAKGLSLRHRVGEYACPNLVRDRL
jgi:hypothetical protein